MEQRIKIDNPVMKAAFKSKRDSRYITLPVTFDVIWLKGVRAGKTDIILEFHIRGGPYEASPEQHAFYSVAEMSLTNALKIADVKVLYDEFMAAQPNPAQVKESAEARQAEQDYFETVVDAVAFDAEMGSW